MTYRLITQPDLAVSVPEVKAALNIDFPDKDPVIDRLIRAETAHLDGLKGLLGKAIMPQTWELVLDSFPSGAIEIALGPVISIDAIFYVDGLGFEQTIDEANFLLDNTRIPGWVVPISGFAWPSTLSAINTARIRFVAGHIQDDLDLESIKQAIILRVQRSLFPLMENDFNISQRSEFNIMHRYKTLVV